MGEQWGSITSEKVWTGYMHIWLICLWNCLLWSTLDLSFLIILFVLQKISPPALLWDARSLGLRWLRFLFLWEKNWVLNGIKLTVLGQSKQNLWTSVSSSCNNSWTCLFWPPKGLSSQGILQPPLQEWLLQPLSPKNKSESSLKIKNQNCNFHSIGWLLPLVCIPFHWACPLTQSSGCWRTKCKGRPPSKKGKSLKGKVTQEVQPSPWPGQTPPRKLCTYPSSPPVLLHTWMLLLHSSLLFWGQLYVNSCQLVPPVN